jgi:hypothetical protein
MPPADEAQRRKALKQRALQQERERLDSSMPLPREEFRALFDHLDVSLAEGCDHTLGQTRAFLQERGLPVDAILPWLVEQGGHCDCEVFANVEERF